MSDTDVLPEIAVVTVALNAARDLPLTLESVLAQSYPRLKLIVADGASWDESDTVLDRYRSRIDHLIVRADAGIYQAMNDVVDEVSSDYVIFLNAGDQFWSFDAIERMVAELDGRPDIFYGNHIYVDRRRELFKRAADFEWLARKLERGVVDHRWHSMIPGHQATFTRTALLQEMRFDTRLRISADHELLFRAHAAGARLQYIDECVAHYHGGGFSALEGERTQIEGASVYRRFSFQPHKVDALFFPHGAPFGAHTEATGFYLSGFTQLGASPEPSGLGLQTCWVSAIGGSIRTPLRKVDGVVLRGWNQLADQGADVLVEGRKIASFAIPASPFRVNVRFDGEFEPGRVLDIVPWRTTETESGEQAAFALQSFQFVSSTMQPDFLPTAGTSVAIGTGAFGETQEFLGTGWSAIEQTHVWSIGRTSDLWLPLALDVRGLVLEVTGNPHVAGGRQRVEIRVNGVMIASEVLVNGEVKRIVLSCTDKAWRQGSSNIVAFVLDASAMAPPHYRDPRDLGICLTRVEFR